MPESSRALEALRAEDPILHRSLTQYDGGHYDARHYGSVILLDGQEVAHLLCCVHCRRHFLNVKIPGQERGWCLNCNGPVCPNQKCDACVPFFRWIESVEKNLPLDQLPIRAAVRGAFFEK